MYLTQIELNKSYHTNKFLKVGSQYSYRYTNDNVESYTNLKKVNSDTLLAYGFDLTDPLSNYYRQQFQPWNGWNLDNINISHSIPLLEKKNLDIPFTNPRNGETVNNTKEHFSILFRNRCLRHESSITNQKPMEYLEFRINIPQTYSEQVITNSTLEMLTSVGLPMDTTFYKEVQTRTPIGDNGTSYINYKFLPTSDPEMGDNDLVINYSN
ncbi:MAG: hypothetical protein IPH97_06250 [Ignavibacteriales bacterium]|nr:hypothetical protein [Ignavibacteriales bacterium]